MMRGNSSRPVLRGGSGGNAAPLPDSSNFQRPSLLPVSRPTHQAEKRVRDLSCTLACKRMTGNRHTLGRFFAVCLRLKVFPAWAASFCTAAERLEDKGCPTLRSLIGGKGTNGPL